MDSNEKEIGSEFWLDSNLYIDKRELNNKKIGLDIKLLLSGRTAIDYVLNEISLKKKINKVYFPSYCCESMLQPFIERNIEIKFYNVTIDLNNELKYDIDTNETCDIFFAMNYFGYIKTNMEYEIKCFNERGCIVIEDATQSLLSDKIYSQYSHYVIASLRKWFPILSGGIAINNIETFKYPISNKLNNKNMIDLRKKAMLLKSKYISGEEIEKDSFLELYKKSSESLENNYKNILMDTESIEILKNIDIEVIRKKRRENAKNIYNMLKNQEMRFLFKKINDGDCPLFVPIILENQEKRNEIRKYLISKKIYCPIHWPKPENVKNNDIYDRELSLICDQRYSVEDIQKYVKHVHK